MNRRGFIGGLTAAVAALCGVRLKPKEPTPDHVKSIRYRTICRDIEPIVGNSAGKMFYLERWCWEILQTTESGRVRVSYHCPTPRISPVVNLDEDYQSFTVNV